MKLTPLKYKTYTWPVNPKTYSLRFEKNTAVHRYPYTNINEIEDLGVKPRETSGEGEFIGHGAYEEFKKLASIFYDKGPGPLIHPNWQIQQAVFQRLELAQEPTPDYVKYYFTFLEHMPEQQVQKIDKEGYVQKPTPKATIAARQKTHVVKQGECLWLIAKKYGTTWQAIAKKNPGIKNPNLIYPGQRIVI